MTHTTALAPVLAGHIAAVNAFDEDAIVATFADDAFVNDAHREFWGADAIRRWVAKEMLGQRRDDDAMARGSGLRVLLGDDSLKFGGGAHESLLWVVAFECQVGEDINLAASSHRRVKDQLSP